ncbi:MAG: hypothetical protein HXX17_14975 [Geobacteraceae bacterium]|nr:hypothetical protein [Geobacteraceae bacterium]
MQNAEAAELLQKGLLALENGHSYLAMTCLEQASRLESTPRLNSWLAYCHALNGRDIDMAIELAKKALHDDSTNPEYCHNLGRIFLLSGRKEEAIFIFRQGLADSLHPELIACLEQLGTRKPPAFKDLSRNHPFNKYAGKLLRILGKR